MNLLQKVSPPHLASGPEMGGRAASREWVWLFAILTLGTLLRLGAWYHRPLDPDEGAQLMDGRFVLGGLVPFVDFGSRQLLYAYLMAAFVGLAGPDYERVRLFVVFTDPLNAALIFAIGRRLFDTRVGLLSAAAYLVFPLVAGLGPIVHTESFAIFFSCAAAYCLLRHLQDGGWGPLLAAGILIAGAVYVRESGLAVALSALLTLTGVMWKSPGALLRRYAVLAAGFLIPCLAVALYYSQFFSLAELWRRPLNPFFVLQPSRGGTALLATINQSLSAGRLVPLPGPHPQPWWSTWQTLGEAALVYLPLLAGAGWAIVWAAGSSGRPAPRRPGYAGALLYPWLICLALAYANWIVHRGFFAEYALELVPPLALLFAFSVFEGGRSWHVGPLPGWATLVLAAGVWSTLVSSHLGILDVPRFMYIAIVPLVVSWPWLTERGMGGIGRWGAIGTLLGLLALPLGPPTTSNRALKLAALGGLIVVGWVAARTQRAPGQARLTLAAYLGLLALGVAAGAADVIGHPRRLRRAGTWPASVVQDIADSLRRRGRPTDQVISGGVIWAFQAGLQPFAGITHPLRFQFGISPGEAAALSSRLQATPPRFIIFDGYTERTYGAVLPDFAQIVSDRYEPVMTLRGGQYPVRLYQLRKAGAKP
jgi:4-amino-4-deoxy-L-arabinose transferase-like glycosyltransferase